MDGGARFWLTSFLIALALGAAVFGLMVLARHRGWGFW